MERRQQDLALADDHRFIVVLCKHLDLIPDAFDPRRADEDRAHLPYPSDVDVGFERLHLTAVRVAPHVDVDDAEDRWLAVGDRARARDHAGARAEDRKPVARALPQRFEQPVLRRQLPDRRRFPTGDDERVGRSKLGLRSHIERIRAGAADGARVRFEVALEGENADLHQPRSASRSDSGMERTSRPRIGSPSPRVTLASTSGSL